MPSLCFSIHFRMIFASFGHEIDDNWWVICVDNIFVAPRVHILAHFAIAAPKCQNIITFFDVRFDVTLEEFVIAEPLVRLLTLVSVFPVVQQLVFRVTVHSKFEKNFCEINLFKLNLNEMIFKNFRIQALLSTGDCNEFNFSYTVSNSLQINFKGNIHEIICSPAFMKHLNKYFSC